MGLFFPWVPRAEVGVGNHYSVADGGVGNHYSVMVLSNGLGFRNLVRGFIEVLVCQQGCHRDVVSKGHAPKQKKEVLTLPEDASFSNAAHLFCSRKTQILIPL